MKGKKLQLRMIVFLCLMIMVLTETVLFNRGIYGESLLAQAATKEFEIEEGTVLVKYNGTAKNVKIPKGITRILEGAFMYNHTIESVVIPNTVKEIGYNSFYDCINLKKVTIPKSVIKMGAPSFRNTPWFNKLKRKNNLIIINKIVVDGSKAKGKVIIPDGIVTIADNAFSNNEKITSITFPKSLKYIMRDAFVGAENLKTVNYKGTIEELNLYSFGGTAYHKNLMKQEEVVIENNFVISGYGCSGEVVLPETITGIAVNAFSNSKIKKVVIPDSIVEIPEYSFESCKELEEVILPSKLKTIGDSAFFGCNKLISIDLPDTITRLEAYSLAHTGEIPHIVVPKGVTSLEDGVFYGANFEKITLPNTLTYIGYKVFMYTNAETIKIPKSVKKIQVWSFAHSSMKNITIPSSLKEIPYYAFANMGWLESITIPKSVKKIDEEAFANTENFTIYGVKGSAAEKFAKKYAKKHKITFKELK